MRLSKKLAIAAVGTVAAVAVSTAAFAAWSASGTGSGSATAGHATALSTVAASASADLLYPSGSADVKIKIHNPNPYQVTVTAINNRGAGYPITSGNTVCDASHGVSFANQTGSWVVGPNTSAEYTLVDAASMSNDSVDACQDKDFSIPVSLVGASS